jgi:hypothetical protein
MTALATATDWRWPPERPGHRLADRPDRRHRQRRQRVVGAPLHGDLVERAQRAGELLAAEEHVLDDVEVVGEREVLVDDLDPQAGRVLRAVQVDALALEETSPESIE